MNLILKRGLLAGLAILVVGFIFSWVIGSIFPGVMNEYDNLSIFRPWDDPLMTAYFAYPFILGTALSYLWQIIDKKIKGEDEVGRAMDFAKIYFFIATIPGMFISYTTFNLSLLMILLWTISGYIDAFIAGWIFAKIKK